jgi:hypothetical protein
MVEQQIRMTLGGIQNESPVAVPHHHHHHHHH